MRLHFAPMEGVTAAVYRRVHAAFFPGVDRYHAPFLAPDGSGRCKASALRELLPENNPGALPVPQILCNRPEPFLVLSRELMAMGYEEVDLNAGCPSATVVPKHKGAGLLADPAELDRFLSELFSRCPLRVSVKTRLGLNSTEEFPALLEVYDRYPISLLTVHVRDRAGMYESPPDRAMFRRAFREALTPLCYNGNLFRRSDAAEVLAENPGLSDLMLGRGAAADPSLFRQLRGGPALEAKELRAFLEELFAACLASGLSEYHALARMKELWYYTRYLFPGQEKRVKALLKARSAADYRAAFSALFSEGFDPSASFPAQGGSAQFARADSEKNALR